MAELIGEVVERPGEVWLVSGVICGQGPVEGDRFLGSGDGVVLAADLADVVAADIVELNTETVQR
jgi:hypothetical protein